MLGKIFGSLTVISLEKKVGGHWYYNCNCLCGKTLITRDSTLKAGKAESCGNCNWKANHPEAYQSWNHMKSRCNNTNHPRYADYGGRGIKIDPRWAHFINFYLDMGDPPVCLLTGQRYTLDREDNDKGYNKDNCRWASYKDQANNRRLPAR